MFVKRTENNLFTRWLTNVDKSILISVLSLIVVGILMMFATTPYAAKNIGAPEYSFIKKAIIYVIIGICVLITTSFLTTREIRYISVIGFAVFFVLLVATLFFPEVKGGRRWISIAGFRLQPSEFLKPLFAVIISMILVRIKDLHISIKSHNPVKILKGIWGNKKEKNYIISLLIIFTLICFILVRQPDIGMTSTFFIIFAAEIFVAGISWWIIAGLGGLSICGLFLAYKFLPHVTARIESFFNFNYQLQMGLNAIKESGLFFGGHTNNLKIKVPDIHTDFIFAAVVEEVGPFISSLLLLVFFFLIIHIITTLKNKTNNFVVFASVGIVAYLSFQICVNISSTLGIIPTKGMTLPFISYGGSSFISSCFAIGVILSLLQDQNLRR